MTQKFKRELLEVLRKTVEQMNQHKDEECHLNEIEVQVLATAVLCFLSIQKKPQPKESISTLPDECPEDACLGCFEKGMIVIADGDGCDGLCHDCEYEAAVCAADWLHDRMKEGGG